LRVPPIGHAFDSLDDVLTQAARSAAVTHNHPEGIKGAQATAAAPNYHFDESCQGTVPAALIAFLESDDYEDAFGRRYHLVGMQTDSPVSRGRLPRRITGVFHLISRSPHWMRSTTVCAAWSCGSAGTTRFVRRNVAPGR
jgi:hypothetical protein